MPTEIKKCVITITPDDPSNQMNIETGGVPTLEILNCLKALMSFFSKQLMDEAKAVAGNDPKAQEQYINQLRQSKPEQN